MLVEFSLNFVYPITCEKNVQVYGVHSPRKHIESRHFHSCPPSPLKTLPQVLTITPSAEGNYSLSPGSIFFRKPIPQTAER